MKYCLFFFALFVTAPVFSQGVTSGIILTRGGDTVRNNRDTLHCGELCHTFKAHMGALGAATSTYSVSAIPYAPYSYTLGTAATVFGGSMLAYDDNYGDFVPIPFTFSFFGVCYNRLIIGTNGNLTFNTAMVNAYDPWPISGPLPGSNCNATFNAIMAPWNDLYPPNGGTINWAVYGTAPNRVLVVSWNAVHLFISGTCGGFTTEQACIYETSNIVEIYIGSRIPCPAWNNGFAVTGIENAAGTLFYTPPGENGTTFTAANEGWRFTPTGASTGWTYTWYDSTRITVIGSADSVTICPSNAFTKYYVEATSPAACAPIWDTFTIRRIFGIGIDSTFYSNPTSCVTNDGVILFHGLPPGDTVVITYSYNGTPVGPITRYPNIDSDIIFTGLPPGVYSGFMLTHDSCIIGPYTFTLVAPPIQITSEDSTNPSICGLCDGSITFHGLLPGFTVTINYLFAGAPRSYTGVVAMDSTVKLTGLCAGAYTNIFASIGSCSTTGRPINLVDPPIIISSETTSNPTICGKCDGVIVLHGLHPSLAVQVNYTKDGTVQPTYYGTVAADGSVTLSDMCAGVYTGISAKIYSCSAPGPNVTLTNPPPIPASFDVQVKLGCNGDEVKVINTSTPSGFTSLWSFGDGSSNAVTTNAVHVYADTPGFTGTYTIKLTYSSYGNPACISTHDSTITFNHPIDAGITSDKDTICLGDSIKFTAHTISTYGPAYLWSFGNGVTSTLANPVYTYPIPGNYIAGLVVTDTIGCNRTANENIQVVSIAVRAGVHDTSVCLRDSMILRSYVTVKPDSTIPFTYAWTQSPGDFNYLGYDHTANPHFKSVGNFIYTVTVTTNYMTVPDLLNCWAQDTERIHSFPPVTLVNLTADQTIFLGSSVQLNADGADRYYWTPANGTLDNANVNNPIATPTDSMTTYTVWGMNLYGCLDSAYINIRVDMDVNEALPSAFTPNGDGLNDVFRLTKLKYQKLVEFAVYNRWGQKVFYTNNSEIGWDGTFNGTPQDMGTYHYQVIVAHPDGTNKIYKGDVTLIR